MDKSMTMAEYAKALAKLPMNYKIAKLDNVSIVQHGGKLIMCNGEHEAIIYNKKWEELKFQTERNKE